MDFWNSINKALDAIREDKPATFNDVRDILHTYGDPDHVGRFGDDAAFFGGSGGDRTLLEALRKAGWHVVWSESSYYYAVFHQDSNELLSYIEGDVERGINGEDADRALTEQIEANDVQFTRSPNGRLLTISL